MSDVGESSRGGASKRVMLALGMNWVRCVMICVWRSLVLSGVRRCLLLVCLASFVSVVIMTVSSLLNEVCLIFSSV